MLVSRCSSLAGAAAIQVVQAGPELRDRSQLRLAGEVRRARGIEPEQIPTHLDRVLDTLHGAILVAI